MFNKFKVIEDAFLSILYATSVLACWDDLSGVRNKNSVLKLHY